MFRRRKVPTTFSNRLAASAQVLDSRPSGDAWSCPPVGPSPLRISFAMWSIIGRIVRIVAYNVSIEHPARVRTYLKQLEV